MDAETPAAPLEKAVEESREALADARKIIDKWIIGYKGPQESELAGHIIILADALRSLLAALYADRGEAEAALKPFVAYWEIKERMRHTPKSGPLFSVGGYGQERDLNAEDFERARRYFARREEKGENRG